MDELPTWAIYASMPVIAAVIGYLTKRVAVEMMFGPVEFRGIPPAGRASSRGMRRGWPTP
jgi:hypothetical protein